MLDQYPAEEFSDPTKTWCDISIGNGAFLSEVLIRKLENGIDLKTSLKTLYGVDIDEDNINQCRKRLSCESKDPQILEILEKNFVVANSENYHFRFDGSYPYDDKVKEIKKEQLWNNLFK